jgi:hypothetical protein
LRCTRRYQRQIGRRFRSGKGLGLSARPCEPVPLW